MLHVDGHFARGRSHAVCQDYALASARRAVVSDGCSSAPHSDVGARLLAHAAMSASSTALASGAWLREPRDAQRQLGLPASCLDATVLIADAHDDGIEVSMFGDGVLAARRRDGRLTLIEVSFDDAAPPYPSYALSAERTAAYAAAGLGTPRLRGTTDAPEPEPRGDALHWRFSRDLWSGVLVGSDGLCAFADGRGLVQPTTSVVQALFRYPSPRGAFVTRRLRKFLSKEAPAMGIHPHDDVALAALCWSDER